MVKIANNNRKTSGLSALGGAVVGAVVAVGAVFLSDKKNRKMISKKFNEAVDAGSEKLEEVGKIVEGAKVKGEKLLEGNPKPEAKRPKKRKSSE